MFVRPGSATSASKAPSTLVVVTGIRPGTVRGWVTRKTGSAFAGASMVVKPVASVVAQA